MVYWCKPGSCGFAIDAVVLNDIGDADTDGDGIPGEPSDGAFAGFSVSFDTLLIRD